MRSRCIDFGGLVERGDESVAVKFRATPIAKLRELEVQMPSKMLLRKLKMPPASAAGDRIS